MGIYEELQARGLIAQVTNEEEIREALATNIPDRIMLDNFSPERTKGAVHIIRTWEKENGRLLISDLRVKAWETGSAHCPVPLPQN